MISYEIPLGLSVLSIVVLYGSLDLTTIVDRQAHYWLGVIPAWNIFTQPLSFFMFLICIHAEATVPRSTLAEAEQELVGGYHTEYSAMRLRAVLPRRVRRHDHHQRGLRRPVFWRLALSRGLAATSIRPTRRSPPA